MESHMMKWTVILQPTETSASAEGDVKMKHKKMKTIVVDHLLFTTLSKH